MSKFVRSIERLTSPLPASVWTSGLVASVALIGAVYGTRYQQVATDVDAMRRRDYESFALSKIIDSDGQTLNGARIAKQDVWSYQRLLDCADLAILHLTTMATAPETLQGRLVLHNCAENIETLSVLLRSAKDDEKVSSRAQEVSERLDIIAKELVALAALENRDERRRALNRFKEHPYIRQAIKATDDLLRPLELSQDMRAEIYRRRSEIERKDRKIEIG